MREPDGAGGVMMFDGLLAESLKIIGAAVAGGLVTLWSTQRMLSFKRKASISISKTAPLGLPGTVLDIKILFEGNEQDQIQFHHCELLNQGTEHLSDIILVFWYSDGRGESWLLKLFNPGGPHLPEIKLIEEDGQYVTIEVDSLAPNERADFTMISSVPLNLRVKCKTDGVRFTDLRDVKKKRDLMMKRAMRFALPIR